MNKYVIGGLVVANALLVIYEGVAKSQEVGMPVAMTGFLCEDDTGVRSMLDKMHPGADFEEAKEMAKGTSCNFKQTYGIVKSTDGRYVNAMGDSFMIIAVNAEDKVLYTWRLMREATAL